MQPSRTVEHRIQTLNHVRGTQKPDREHGWDDPDRGCNSNALGGKNAVCSACLEN